MLARMGSQFFTPFFHGFQDKKTHQPRQLKSQPQFKYETLIPDKRVARHTQALPELGRDKGVERREGRGVDSGEVEG
jgi:hypothetical protein